eukprot:147690-Pelagomonas_calceolata.AAC.2
MLVHAHDIMPPPMPPPMPMPCCGKGGRMPIGGGPPIPGGGPMPVGGEDRKVTRGYRNKEGLQSKQTN